MIHAADIEPSASDCRDAFVRSYTTLQFSAGEALEASPGYEAKGLCVKQAASSASRQLRSVGPMKPDRREQSACSRHVHVMSQCWQVLPVQE